MNYCHPLLLFEKKIPKNAIETKTTRYHCTLIIKGVEVTLMLIGPINKRFLNAKVSHKSG